MSDKLTELLILTRQEREAIPPNTLKILEEVPKMKKTAIVVAILALITSSAIVGATGYGDHKDDTGINVVEWTSGPANDDEINRTKYTVDINDPNPGSQVVQVDLNAHAFIPCYIRMDVNGNGGKAAAESFGPGATAKVNGSNNFYLLFDNEVGGFCDKDWNVLGHGRNAQILPSDSTFIRGCDTFKVVVYANDSYKYDVVSSPLKKVDAVANAGDVNLALDMRTKVDAGNWGSTVTFATDNQVVNVAEKKACETMTAMHQFRVPYKKTTAQGHYNGVVTFKAYLI